MKLLICFDYIRAQMIEYCHASTLKELAIYYRTQKVIQFEKIKIILIKYCNGL